MKIIIGNKTYTNNNITSKYYDDLLILQRLMEELGFPKIDLDEIETMWDKISDNYCASWLGVPKDKETLLIYLEEIAI